MTFDNWWKDYGKDRDSCEYVVAKDAFKAGQEAGDEKIADLKANFDYILEGKEIEYREERKKLCDDFENMKAGLESQIATLGERCNQLLKDKGNLTDELDERTKDLLNANHRIEQMQDAKCTSCTELGGLQLKIKELEAQIEKLQKINKEQKETLKKVRVALIQERTANIMNYGKGGVEMFDDCFEILKGVSN